MAIPERGNSTETMASVLVNQPFMPDTTASVDNETVRPACGNRHATNEPSDSSTRHADKICFDLQRSKRCARDDVRGSEKRLRRRRTETTDSSTVTASIIRVENENLDEDERQRARCSRCVFCTEIGKSKTTMMFFSIKKTYICFVQFFFFRVTFVGRDVQSTRIRFFNWNIQHISS